MDMDVSDVKRSQFWRNWVGRGAALPILCVCALLTSQLMTPMLAQGDQHSNASAQPSADQNTVPDSKHSAKPQKEQSPAQPSSQESTPAQAKTKKANGEEGTEKDKEGPGKKAVLSLILTVKLALMEDPNLFPYEIEVEGGSDDVTLVGKVATEAEKAAAGKIASMVPAVKSVSNKLEVVKDLPGVLAHRQDDIITRHVKERFAKSATVKAADFEVKTEQGVVSLSGAVRFQVIVLEAAEAARQVPGVRAVKTDKVKIESEG